MVQAIGAAAALVAIAFTGGYALGRNALVRRRSSGVEVFDFTRRRR